QTSANGTTAFILPNKNGVVALGRASVGARSQPVNVKSLSIESTLGQQPVFVNLQAATHRGALHMGNGQTACTLVQSGPNATIYRLPLSQSSGAGYSTMHPTTLQSPVAMETVHST
uniref:Mixed-lineage leukemia-like protein n=1 Tax=Plectus sambesii TaxID=2011161 RepID=A0A914VYD5_9BILA